MAAQGYAHENLSASPQELGERVTLSLEQTDIRHLVQWASTYLDKTIIVHPSVQANITVLAGEPIPIQKVKEVFLTILQVYGFIAVETETTIKILPDSMTATSGSGSLTEKANLLDEEIVSRVIPIEGGNAEYLVGKLTPFLTTAAKIAVFPDSNLLLVADRASSIKRLAEILERIDIPSRLDIRVIQLEHTNAVDVLAIVKEMVPSIQEKKPRGVNFTADSYSNSIVYKGDAAQTSAIVALIKRLDRPLSYNTNTQVIRLNYTKANSIAPILTSIATGIEKRIFGHGKAKAATLIETSEKQNALIITAQTEVMTELRQVISDLDKKRLQVLVEALIVEVNEEEAKDIGLEWRALIGNEGGYAGNAALTKNLPTPELPGLGPGLTLGFLRLDETSLLIRALEVSSAANILSKPTIVALDNEEAEILVGENVPFITGSSTSSASSTDNPFQTITRQDIGITLKIRPQINENGSITLDIRQKVESLSESITSTADVVTNKREIKTHVSIEHDQVLVLGGLIRDELQESTRKVPILGDIPLIGRLFRGNSTQLLKRNLMVFIHPRILRASRDGISVTNQHYRQMGRNQEYINNKIDRFFISQPPPHIRNEQYWVVPPESGKESDEKTPIQSQTILEEKSQ
ncbi:MAG: type II secretion system secretin GspD [Halioglobus sp.]